MSEKSLYFFGKKSFLYIRDLIEKNETLLRINATSPSQKSIHKVKKDEDDKVVSLLGIPVIIVILIGILFICVSSCIILLICRCREMFTKKEFKREKRKENKEDNKNIEMSQAKKDYYCGHIQINSLD